MNSIKSFIKKVRIFSKIFINMLQVFIKIEENYITSSTFKLYMVKKI